MARTATLRLACALLFAPIAAAGQSPGPLVTDRPDQTESAVSVGAGLVQLEVGWTHFRDEVGGTTLSGSSLPETLVRIGLGAGLEARLGFGGWATVNASPEMGPDVDASGLGDGSVGVKWSAAETAGGLRFALLGTLSVPIGEEGFSSDHADPSLRALVSHPVGERVSFGYNLGIARVTDAAGTGTEAPYTFAVGLGLSDRVGVFVESFGAFGLGDDRPTVHSADTGLTLLLSDMLQLDVSGGVGLNEAADDWFVGSGVSLRIPR